MTVAASPTCTGVAPSSSEVATIRRFVCFPDSEDLVPRGSIRPVEFRVVILYGSGLVASFWSRSRTLPQAEDFLEFDHVLRDMSRLGWTTGYATQVAVEELGLNLEVIDHPLDDIPAWNVEAHLVAALTNLAATVAPAELAARREVVSAAARLRLQAALDGFMAELDAEVLAIVGRPVLPAHYNHFAAGDPVLRRNRLQGWTTFPLAFRYLSEPLPPQLLVSILSRAIDAGKPLVPLLATRAKLTQATARAVLACPAEVAIAPWRCDLAAMGAALELVEPAFRPRTGPEWVALHTVILGLQRLLGRQDHPELLRRWLNDIAKEGWSRWGPEEDHEMAFIVVEEMARAAREVAGRGRQPPVTVKRAIWEILGRKRFATVVRLGRAWEAAFQREQDRIASEASADMGTYWQVPLSVFRAGERVLHALASPSQLYVEGKAMNHCVGSYVGQSLSGLILIWSVRTPQGERRSTLAIGFAEGKDGAAFVSQHKGPGNCRPDRECEAAADALVVHLNNRREELAGYHTWRVAAERRYASEFDDRTQRRVSEAALRAVVPELLEVAGAGRAMAAYGTAQAS